MIQLTAADDRSTVTCLGLMLRIAGSAAERECYLERFGLRRLAAVPPPLVNAPPLELDIEVSADPPTPPAEAIQSGPYLCFEQSIYVQVDRGWSRIEACDHQRWRLTRTSASGDFRLEQSLLAIAALRCGCLPLHSSVFQLGDVGVACLGGPDCGKSSLLLAMLGGEDVRWLCDDQAYCDSTLQTAYACSESVEAKHGYLVQDPALWALVPAADRWKLSLQAACRRGAGVCTKLPQVPQSMRRTMTRIAAGQARVAVAPDRHCSSVDLDVAVLVARGARTRLTPLPAQRWVTQAQQVLWPEVRELHELHRRLQAATGGNLIGGEKDDEIRLTERLSAFASGKRTLQLVRSPELPLGELGQLVRRSIQENSNIRERGS